MSKSNYPLKAPASILAAARRAAQRDGVSLNQFINTALAENIDERIELYRRGGDLRSTSER